MTAENCLFHGSRDRPAARELTTLDNQINRRLHAELVIRETRGALYGAKAQDDIRAIHPVVRITGFQSVRPGSIPLSPIADKRSMKLFNQRLHSLSHTRQSTKPANGSRQSSCHRLPTLPKRLKRMDSARCPFCPRRFSNDQLRTV